MPTILEKSVDDFEKEERFNKSIELAHKSLGEENVSIDKNPQILSLNDGAFRLYNI